jgi:hypothetical protein
MRSKSDVCGLLRGFLRLSVLRCVPIAVVGFVPSVALASVVDSTPTTSTTSTASTAGTTTSQVSAGPSCSGSWKVVALADPGQLWGVSTRAPNDVWAVGDANLIQHWNGRRWTVSQPGSDPTKILRSVSAASATAAWAVGWVQDPVKPWIRRPLVEHWDGTHWFEDPTPAAARKWGQFNGIVALAPDDAWVVGIGGKQRDALIEHWDGEAWHIVPSPNVARGPESGSELLAVAAAASDEIWAVGEYYRRVPSWNGNGMFWPLRVTALVEHWDGTAWSIGPPVPLTSVPPDPDPTYWGLTQIAVSPDDEVETVAGDWGRAYRLEGATWSPDWPGSAAPQSPPRSFISGTIAFVAHNDAWAVGSGYQGMKNSSLIAAAHWDGETWGRPHPLRVRRIIGVTGLVDAISASTSTNIWVVGGLGARALHYTC